MNAKSYTIADAIRALYECTHLQQRDVLQMAEQGMSAASIVRNSAFELRHAKAACFFVETCKQMKIDWDVTGDDWEPDASSRYYAQSRDNEALYTLAESPAKALDKLWMKL